MPKAPLDPASTELDQAREIAATSGNAFHAKVATYFRNQGWSVLISPYYVDNATGQAREIDLLCEQLFAFQMHREDDYGIYRVQLFVECKYLPSPAVFWFDQRDHKRTLEWLDQKTPFSRGRTNSHRAHRYISIGTHVAKLFRSADSRENYDPIYKGLAQSLGALIQRRGSPLLGQPPDEHDEPSVDVTVQYPVIVFGGPAGLYRADIDGDPSSVLPAPQIFQLEVDYAYTHGDGIAEDYFLIDVLRFGELDSLLGLLDREAKEAIRLLSD